MISWISSAGWPALVDAAHGLGAGRRGQAEHVSADRVFLGMLEVDLLVVLDGEVRVMCLVKGVVGYPHDAGVHIREPRHSVCRSACITTGGVPAPAVSAR